MNQELQKSDRLDRAIMRGTASLLLLLHELYQKEIEPLRLALSVRSLLTCGVTPSTPVVATSIQRLAELQQPDGGWTGTVDTCCCAYIFGLLHGRDTIERACCWLQAQKRPGGGWGRFPRDISRIPTTSLVINTLLDQHFSAAQDSVTEAAAYLIGAWQKEFAPQSLTYKASHVLSTLARLPSGAASDLGERTLDWLIRQQEPGGGYAPWRGHPGGPTAQTTAVVLDGLLDWGCPVPAPTMEGMVHYLLAHQETSGCWPEHEIDAVSSRALAAIYRYASRAVPHASHA